MRKAAEARTSGVLPLSEMEKDAVGTLLWVVQVGLAAVFVGSGSMKLLMSPARLVSVGVLDRQGGGIPLGGMRAIGALEILGAAGLIVPGATGFTPWLTVVVAAGLGIVMIGAIVLHIREGELKEIPVCAMLLGLSVAVAALRATTVVP